MKNIIEVPATESLLITYFFQLYERGMEECFGLEFNEMKLKDIIASKRKNEMISNELFQCSVIHHRWKDWMPKKENLPKKFYYFNYSEEKSTNIDNHPVLYTSIKPLNGNSFFRAEIGFEYTEDVYLSLNLGCDLLDENLNFLKFINPNLYDNGNYDVHVYSNTRTLIIIYIDDENNGPLYSYFIYENEELTQVLSILEKELFFDLVQMEMKDNEFLNLFKLVDEELKADKEVVIAAVSANGKVLELVSEKLKADKEVVLKAVSSNGFALEFTSEELKSDKEVVLRAVSSNGSALKFASEELKSHKEVVLAAISQDGYALCYANEELKADKEVAIEALSLCPEVFKFLSENLRKELYEVFNCNQKLINLDDNPLPF